MCICAIISVWLEFSNDWPFISKISSATSKSAFSAGDPVKKSYEDGMKLDMVLAISFLSSFVCTFSCEFVVKGSNVDILRIRRPKFCFPFFPRNLFWTFGVKIIYSIYIRNLFESKEIFQEKNNNG